MIVTNNRIRQLAEQAKQYAEDKQNDPLKIYTLDCFNEKFAELIISDIEDEVSRLKRRVDVLEAELLHPK